MFTYVFFIFSIEQSINLPCMQVNDIFEFLMSIIRIIMKCSALKLQWKL